MTHVVFSRLLSAQIALVLLLGQMLLVGGAEAQKARTFPRPVADYQAALARQEQLVEASIAGLLPPDPDLPTNYFVGFSGWSDQDVFIREIAQAREIVDERFATRDRSLLLVNHELALEEVPLATVRNLEAVLGRLGRMMRPDKDTLILFLTSHGNDGLFGIHFPPFRLSHLTPAALAQVLEHSGIKNRIIIISACHSGSFIPALSTPTSVVLTAARADRASFGCSNENDWTFFGDALFNHALRRTNSLTDAFAAARGLISQWERKKKYQPSEPQIFVGDDAAPLLARLAQPQVETASNR